jgi:hypothetical protein
MLATPVSFEPETRMALIDVPDSVWDSGLDLRPQAA